MRKLNRTLVVSLMGVDGSGKTTFVTKLNKKFKKRYKKIKNLHLRPYFFLTDTSIVNSNPHNQKPPRSEISSLITILMWLFIYHIFFFLNLNKKNQLIIFDRYAHDILIDKKRYRLTLSKKITQFILSLFPKPDLWIVLKGPIKLIEKRKKELPTNELKRQMSEYKNLSKTQKNTLVINKKNNIGKNISLIARKMKSIIN